MKRYLPLSWRRVKKGGKKMTKPIKTVLVLHDPSQMVARAFRARGDIAYSVSRASCGGGYPGWHIQQSPLELLTELKVADRGELVYARTEDGHIHTLVPKDIDLVVVNVASGMPGTSLWNRAKSIGAAVCMTMPRGAFYRSINATTETVRGFTFYLHGVPQLCLGDDVSSISIPEEMARQWG